MTPEEWIRDQMLRWRQDLINLGRANRLLYFKATKSTLEILEPAATDLLRGLGGSGFPFFEPPDRSNPSAHSVSTEDELPREELRPKEILTNSADRPQLLGALKSLERRTTQEFMDKGLWVLYLGVGMVEWVNVEGDEHERVQSPLLLVPVVLEHDNPQRPYQLRRADEETAINPALAAKLEHDFGLLLPTIDDIEDAEPEKLFETVRQQLRQHPDWRVTPKVVLGTFSFHKDVMYRDLLTNEQTIAEHPLIRAIALKPGESDVDLNFDLPSDDRLDELAPPEEMLTILDADGSQRRCILAAREGRSFVMDGPPGTGKSQTIANVIAELLARGQTVLFVSEKAAALEVVQRRLRDAGIDEFALALHSHKTTRREVARELGRALTHHPRPATPLEPVKLERLITRRKELSDYAEALNEVRPPLGQSLQNVLGRIVQLQALPQAPHPEGAGRVLDGATLVQLLEGARALSRAWAPVGRAGGFVWRDLATTALDAARARRIMETLTAAEAALKALESLVVSLANEIHPDWRHGPADAARFDALLKQLQQREPVPLTWLADANLDGIEGRARQLYRMAQRARELRTDLEAIAGPRWAEFGGRGEANALNNAVSNMDRVIPGWVVDEGWAHGAIDARARFLGASARQLTQAGVGAGRIAGAFGLPEDNTSLERASELAELAMVAASPTPPEASWLDPAALAVAQEAARILEEHVAELLRYRETLVEVFTDKVLDLDLQGLCVRFDTVHRGWRKLLPAHFRDRRTLAPCTRSGRIGVDVLARLRKALAWKKAKERLSVAETRHARHLGRYYRRDRTDFVALRNALSQARRALEIVGAHLDRAALQRQLTAHGEGHGKGDQVLVPLAHELRTSVGAWLQEARGWLGDPVISGLSRRPINDVAALCEQGGAFLQIVSDVVGRAALLAGKDLSLGAVRQCLSLGAEFTESRTVFEEGAERDSSLFGSNYRGLDTDWEALQRSLSWVRRLREILGDGSLLPVDQTLMSRLYSTEASAHKTTPALERWRSIRDTLCENFVGPHREWVLGRLEGEFEDGLALLATLRDTVDDISTWEAFTNARSALEAAGLAETTQFCVEGRVDKAQVAGVFERAILERWTDEVIRSDRRLQYIRPEDRNDFVREFQSLDRDFIRLAAGRVIEQCNSIRPTTTAGAAGIILYQANLQKKHMPVPKLLTVAHEVVQALKPCFMMSPLTVSQFLPTTMRFDVIVFDEASQVRPADAINCIYRGRSLIVAGDQKQLPPTTFFEGSLDGDDEWEEEELPDFESVLDLCQAHGFPSLTLRWHYRSQHEDLITFSNYSFYDGRLLTFPGAQESGSDLGVELFPVPGTYRRGGARDNPVEAKKVVERVLFHRLNHPTLSLGVVAFSEAQATAIESALETQRAARPELRRLLDKDDRLRGFFIKNLETVQGDERDILIFSIGYGRDENGKFTMQFGPLNRKGGERRLNVAVTRARRRVEVVSSVTTGEFVGESGSDGVRHLKRYLDYAGRAEHKVRALALDVQTTGHDVESPFEEEVCRVVRSWGFDAVAQVGCAGYRVDLAVRHPARPGLFALGIECDGAAYHSSRVARDRDRLRQEILTGLGWRLHRIWGPSWYRNRREQEARLRQVIDAAVAVAPSALSPAPAIVGPPPDATVELAPVALDGTPEWTVPYAIADPKRPQLPAQMHEDAAQAELCRMIEEVVRIEGPAHQDLVLRRVREAWGIQRAGSRIRAAFDSAVRSLCHRAVLVRDEEHFLSTSGSRLRTVRGVTEDPRSCRGVEEVPRVELEIAVAMIVNDARLITWEELTGRVAKLFGWSRRGSDIARALDSVIESQIQEGALVKDDEALKPGKPGA